MQTVRIVNVKTGTPVTVETEATLFGELVDQLKRVSPFDSYDFSKCHCFVRSSEGRSSIGLPDEELPSDDTYTLYISPAEMKGGADMESLREVLEDIRDSVNEALELIGDDNDLREYEDEDIEIIKRRL